MKRILTALVLAPLFIGVVWYGDRSVFTALVLAVAAVCFSEYARMASHKGIAVFRLPGIVSVILIPLAFAAGPPLPFIAAGVIVVLMFLLSLPDADNGLTNLAFTLLGVLYIGVCFAGPVLMRGLPDGERLFLLGCVGVWGSDTAAYYAGRAFGKHKLAPAVSPGKTVEGSVGGLFGSFIFCFLFARFLMEAPELPVVLAAAVIGGIVGPVGDLAESKLKRYFGVKDSGAILPGHGGLLDRADALMFALPVFYIFLVLNGGGA